VRGPQGPAVGGGVALEKGDFFGLHPKKCYCQQKVFSILPKLGKVIFGIRADPGKIGLEKNSGQLGIVLNRRRREPQFPLRRPL
jgi:hypothetical protein